MGGCNCVAKFYLESSSNLILRALFCTSTVVVCGELCSHYVLNVFMTSFIRRYLVRKAVQISMRCRWYGCSERRVRDALLES